MNIQQNPPTNTLKRTDEIEFVVNAPGLNHFRLNPFQTLRLSEKASSAEAVWQAEKILPGLRLGLPPKGTAPISWLASVNEMEVQQAVQKIEEPLERLLEQLFWFDFDADSQGVLLHAALVEADANKLSTYLQQSEAAPALATLPLPKEEKFDNQDESNSEATSDDVATSPEEQIPNGTDEQLEGTLKDELELSEQTTKEESDLTAEMVIQAAVHDLNRANLQLLLAVSNFHHVGPMIESSAPHSALNGSSTYQLDWENDEELSLSWNPHLRLATSPSVNGQDSDWQRFWSDGLTAWNQILNSPHFGSYIDYLIQGLGDELLDQGVVDTLKRAIPTRLADMLANEIRSTISEGTSGRVTQLVTIAGNAPFDPRIWQATFSSLNFFFQSELADLNTLIDESDSLNPETIRLYFDRLGRIKDCWQSLDPAGILGLDKLLDEAVINGYQSISSLSYAGNRLKEVHDLLEHATSYASSLSVKGQIRSYHAQITKFHEHVTCHFCEQREHDPNLPVVLRGKKETGEEWHWGSRTIHYLIKHNIVPRCNRCADFQDYIQDTTTGMIVTVIIALGILSSFFPDQAVATLTFLLFMCLFPLAAIFIPFIGGIIATFFLRLLFRLYRNILRGLHNLVRSVVWRFMLHEDENAFYSIESTPGYKELIYEGYGIEKIDLRKTALKTTLASSE